MNLCIVIDDFPINFNRGHDARHSIYLLRIISWNSAWPFILCILPSGKCCWIYSYISVFSCRTTIARPPAPFSVPLQKTLISPDKNDHPREHSPHNDHNRLYHLHHHHHLPGFCTNTCTTTTAFITSTPSTALSLQPQQPYLSPTLYQRLSHFHTTFSSFHHAHKIIATQPENHQLLTL